MTLSWLFNLTQLLRWVSFGVALSLFTSVTSVIAKTPGVGNSRTSTNVSDPSIWRLVWSDEFNGANGSSVDSSKWGYDIGGWGWGNNELEYYTNRPQNSYIENGSLVIKAVKENFTGTDGVTRGYTSARLLTKNKFAQKYGRFEARIKIPYGQGIWPAFWMLGDNIASVGWPQCGEIDIMENIGKEPSIVHGTIHGPGYSGGSSIGAAYSLSNDQRFADDYHTFAVEWEPQVIRFYVDGILYKTRTPADLPAGKTWVYDHPFFIILNLAVGGGWPGNPDATTVFPQTMLVDYVRVYQRDAPSNIPLLLTDDAIGHALALDSVTFKAEPFFIVNDNNFSQDRRTRVTLFLANTDLVSGDTASIITGNAQDANGNTFPVKVEYLGKIETFDWITQVVVRLPDELMNKGEVWVQLNVRGQDSNRAIVSVK